MSPSVFRKIFSDLEIWQHPVIVLDKIPVKIMRLLLEFIYKGVVQMKEERIEDFLEAGKFLEVKGVSVSDNIHISDGDADFSPEVSENSADLVFNSTVSSEHSHQVENLREANHLRSFVHDISNIQHRPLRQEVSVNIRRMTKEDTMLHSTHNLDILNNSLDTSRRSSRSNRSNINYCEELPEHSTSFSKSSRSNNISKLQSRSRRSLLDTTGSEEVDMEELFLLENNGDNFGHCKTLSSTGQIPAARRRSAPAPGGRMECDQCRESIATQEMGHHMRTMHRRSRRSLPEPSQGGRSVPNLGSLYRTKPLESRRSTIAKNNTEINQKNQCRKKSKTLERPASSVDKNERLRMLKSLGGEAEIGPAEVNRNADRDMDDNVNVTNYREKTNNENVINSTNPGPGTDETANPSQTNNVSQYPSSPSTQDNASDFEVSPVSCQQSETELDPENSSNGTHGNKNETKIGPGDTEVLTHYEISRHIVSLSGRSMCKICGIQVTIIWIVSIL